MQRLHDILEIESDALEFVEYITWVSCFPEALQIYRR